MRYIKEYSYNYLRKSNGGFADEFVRSDTLAKEIEKGNPICMCPCCDLGCVYDYDVIEKIGLCSNCFEQVKLN